MKKKIISVLFISSLQTILFILLYDNLPEDSFPAPSQSMISSGISSQIGYIEFIIFALLLNTFLIIYPRIHAIWPIFATIVFYSVTWMSELLNETSGIVTLLASAAI